MSYYQKHRRKGVRGIKTCRATFKGIVALAAFEAGLCQKAKDGWDISAFEKFWDCLQMELLKQGYQNLDDLTEVFCQKRDSGRNNSSKQNLFDLKTLAPCILGGLLGALLAQFLKVLF